MQNGEQHQKQSCCQRLCRQQHNRKYKQLHDALSGRRSLIYTDPASSYKPIGDAKTSTRIVDFHPLPWRGLSSNVTLTGDPRCTLMQLSPFFNLLNSCVFILSPLMETVYSHLFRTSREKIAGGTAVPVQGLRASLNTHESYKIQPMENARNLGTFDCFPKYICLISNGITVAACLPYYLYSPIYLGCQDSFSSVPRSSTHHLVLP